MIERRKISIEPDTNIHYLVDTNFFVNKYLNESLLPDDDAKRVSNAKDYWKIIDAQLEKGSARVFLLDICVAEAFKTLAKKYYDQTAIFKNYGSYNHVLKKIRSDISLSSKDAKKSDRKIKYHDIQTNRDIIISVDRYFENISKKKLHVQLADVLVLATGKYLLDFYGMTLKNLAFITQDNKLYKLSRMYNDHPAAFNPNLDKAKDVFKIKNGA